MDRNRPTTLGSDRSESLLRPLLEDFQLLGDGVERLLGARPAASPTAA